MPQKQTDKQQPKPRKSPTSVLALIEDSLSDTFEPYDPTVMNHRILRALAMIILKVTTSSTVLVSMIPVYGSIPTYQNVSELFTWWIVMMIMLCLSVSLLPFDARKLQKVRILVSLWTVLLRFFLFSWMFEVGPRAGPFFTQTVTVVPVIFSGCIGLIESLTAVVVKRNDDASRDVNSSISLKRFIESFLSGCLTLALCRVMVPSCARIVSNLLGWQVYWGQHIMSRYGLIRLASACYLVFEQLMQPRKSGWREMRRLVITAAVLELLALGWHYTAVASVQGAHMRTLDSIESITGYISVLQGITFPSLIMRNDHSMLGGVWLPDSKTGYRVIEPAFPVFCMLEAVRLIECGSCEPNDKQKQPGAKNALVIGLGVGTAPAALNAHGVNTSVVELDPAVIAFAKNHFHLPRRIKTINMDALVFAQKAFDQGQKFDYIIHDVFTGGAEPAELFTHEFLTLLKSLLKLSGTIAINYAGGLKHESTRRILLTICTVFPQCRAYRDSKPGEVPGDDADMVNMVVYARSDGSEWTFKTATEEDFMGSQARRAYLIPQTELSVGEMIHVPTTPEILYSKDVPAFAKGQFESACIHWGFMRKAMRTGTWSDF